MTFIYQYGPVGLTCERGRGELDTLIGALAERPEVKNLTAVSNNAGSGDNGLGQSLYP